MVAVPDDVRHLTFATLDQLWQAGVPMALPIQGGPHCELLLDPKNGLLTLSTDYDAPEPNVASLKNVTFEPVTVGDDERAELTIRVEGNVHGAYGLLATIADELQLNGAPLAVAVATAVNRHRNVFASRGSMSVEQELGLFGELLFLEYLLHEIGAGPALAAWQGPNSEEHDFAFSKIHLEVKTTSGEARRHIINGLAQLVPLRGVPLFLLSIQVTRSDPDGGRTLPQLVEQVRTATGGHQAVLDPMLSTMGWRDDDADLYTTFWVLRSDPRAYPVERDFPAVTPKRLAKAVPNHELLSDVSYRIDLANLPFKALPEPMAGFASTERATE